MRLLTAAETRALDRATMAGGHASGEALMEAAGAAVAAAIERRWGSPLALRVLALCGPGHNGGDGFVAARHLHARGARVRVAVCGPRARVDGEARAHLGALEAAGVRPAFDADAAALAALAGGDWDVALDALLGTGASGPPRGAVAAGCATLAALRARGTRIVAVDLPTGVDADDGALADGAVRADLTVTFGEPRRGHWLYPGRTARGELEVADIGHLPAARAGVEGVELATAAGLAALLPARDPRAHKGSVGRVLVVGGAPGTSGAPILAARAAARAGAGYVRVAAPASLQDVLAAQLVEPMVVAAPETGARTLSTFARALVTAEAARAVVLLGPGLSRHPESAALARELFASLASPLVLDADGLAAFAPAPALPAAPGPRVLTPHVGEMARLTGLAPEALEARRIDAAREWARRWGCVLVLKGAPTVVADATGRACVNPTGNPGMATAGMGDVLGGAVAALLAAGLDAYDAARVAAYAHGLAGDAAARARGATGLIAGDVIEELPRALQSLRDAR